METPLLSKKKKELIRPQLRCSFSVQRFVEFNRILAQVLVRILVYQEPVSGILTIISIFFFTFCFMAPSESFC